MLQASQNSELDPSTKTVKQQLLTPEVWLLHATSESEFRIGSVDEDGDAAASDS
jgi:hypothetical protein